MSYLIEDVPAVTLYIYAYTNIKYMHILYVYINILNIIKIYSHTCTCNM